MTEQMAEPQEMVSRTEFETHQRRVSNDIENLAEAIREEGRQRGKDTAVLREDIKALSGKPRSLEFAIFSFVLAALAGVYSFGESRLTAAKSDADNQLTVAMNQLALERVSSQGLLIAGLTAYDDKQDANTMRSTEQGKESLEREILDLAKLLKSEILGNENASAARHEMQNIQIAELERRAALGEAWQEGHDFHVRGKNSAQDKQIEALERLVFGVTWTGPK